MFVSVIPCLAIKIVFYCMSELFLCGIYMLISSPFVVLISHIKAWFSYVGTIPDDRGFYCFPTVPDFAD